MLAGGPEWHHALVEGVLESFDKVFLKKFSSYNRSQRRAFFQSNSAYSIGVLFGGQVNFMTSASVLPITSSVVYVSKRKFTS